MLIGGFNPRFDGPPPFDGPPSFDGPPPFDGPPFDGPPFDGPPFDGPPFDGPPFDGPPFDGPPFEGGPPPFDGPPFPGPPFDEPPFDGPFRGPRGRGFRRFEDRTWVRPDFKQPGRGGRRSRWGGEQEGEPDDGPPPLEREDNCNEGEPQNEGEGGEFIEQVQSKNEVHMDEGEGEQEMIQDGKSTPVIDERPPPLEVEEAVQPPGTEAPAE